MPRPMPHPAASGPPTENAMTEEEAKKKQLLAAYAWGRHSAAAPECFALDPDKLVALCALGVMPPKVEKGAGSTPATGSAGNGVSVGEQPAATCVATTTNTMGAGEKAVGAKHTPGPWTLRERGDWIEVIADGRPVAIGAVVDRSDPSTVSLGFANANLIAAAPDLLAACRRILVEDGGCSCSEGYCAWCLASAAIAKAEGRS